MVAFLSSAAVVLPAWTRGPVRVEGPDEDAFTLLARAGELLRGAQPTVEGARAQVRTIRLVASLSGEDRDQLFEAWGVPPIPVVGYPETSEGAAKALSDAMDVSGSARDGADWVLTAQVALVPGAGPEEKARRSAGAVGLSFLSSEAAPRPPPEGGEATAPRSWATSPRGAAAEPYEVTGSHTMPGSPLRMLLTIAHAATQAAPGERASWVHASEERTWLREFLDGRKVPVVGYPVEGEAPLRPVSEEAWRARSGAPLGAVSQGAYLSRESYKASIPARWRLEGESCGTCRGWTLPPRGVCHHCGARDGLRRGRLPRTGAVVESSTTIHKGAQPTEFDYHQEVFGDYAVALVRFPDGPRLTFQLTDPPPEGPLDGRSVELVLRRLYPQEGAWRYGLKAVVRG